MRYLFILTFISIFFYGCSISGHYYLRNSTDEKVVVKMKISEFAHKIEEINPRIKRGAEKIKFNSLRKLSEKLSPIKVLKNEVWYEIPPNSFAFIGYGLNYNYRNSFDFIEVKGKKIDLSDWEIWRDKRTSYSGYVCWLEI